jgi:hypothetical protein
LASGTGKNKPRGVKKQDPERIYREASAARKVKQYLDIHWDKIIKDEDRLISVSKNLEPPAAPNSSTLSRKSNGDTLSIHSSPGLTLKHKPKHSHQRTGAEPSIRSPKVTVTKGYSRQMVPVSELPKFGVEDSSKLSKILSLAEPPGVSRYGERRRHKSGQSDSSINTDPTSRTNYSEPITTTNVKIRKSRPPGLPPSPSLPLSEVHSSTTERRREKKEKSRSSNRPISENFGTMTLTTSTESHRQRQKSVDNSSQEKKSERKEKSSRHYHRSTPIKLQAPINPIYQPRERDSSFITKI